MAHLIRSVSGTNRDPIYGPWRNCELCRDYDAAETEALDKVVAETPQILGMSLAEFWDAYVAEKLAAEIHPGQGSAET
jgi:hypothetical protein